MIAPTFSGEKNSAGEDRPGVHLHEPVHTLLLAVNTGKQLLHFERWRLERSTLGAVARVGSPSTHVANVADSQ